MYQMGLSQGYNSIMGSNGNNGIAGIGSIFDDALLSTPSRNNGNLGSNNMMNMLMMMKLLNGNKNGGSSCGSCELKDFKKKIKELSNLNSTFGIHNKTMLKKGNGKSDITLSPTNRNQLFMKNLHELSFEIQGLHRLLFNIQTEH